MTHAWVTEEQFVWALNFFFRTLSESELEPIPRPSAEAIQYAASRIAAINRPIFGRVLHRSLAKKLAVAVYELCKQHFFLNGNKRIAYFFLRFLLLLNDRKLRAGLQRRADLLKWIAESDPKRREQVIRSIVRFLQSEIVLIPESDLAKFGFASGRPPTTKK